MEQFHINKLVVVGVGLIGGSVAAALRKAGCVGRVIGIGRGRANIERALALGVIDEISHDLQLAAQGADVVIVCVPVQQAAAVLERLRGALHSGMIVTDAASTKLDFIAMARKVLGERARNVVPGHPIAGAELSGVDAASPTLFVGKRVVLTPMPESDAGAVARVDALWRACGAQVTRMDAEHHDRVFSAVSHLPHVLAYALVGMIASRSNADELFSFAAGGFRDFTRIAGSSPEMWRDICLANRELLVADIQAFQNALSALADQMRAGDAAALDSWFDAARRAREAWIDGTR
ncbi:MAG: prephenate dehydrogenase [Burkholderiales bacterium]